MEEKVVIWTDGAISKGNGGWAYVILEPGQYAKEKSGGAPNTTSNRMELTAALEALKALGDTPRKVQLHSDSAYLINCFKQAWWVKWVRLNWIADPVERTEVANRDLWEQLIEQHMTHEIEWVKVKGHVGVEWNERCDELAKFESKVYYT